MDVTQADAPTENIWSGVKYNEWAVMIYHVRKHNSSNEECSENLKVTYNLSNYV